MSRENKTKFPRIGFTVTDEDITKLEVDCIVNAANKTLVVLTVPSTERRARNCWRNAGVWAAVRPARPS